jgi:hypothetical protein
MWIGEGKKKAIWVGKITTSTIPGKRSISSKQKPCEKINNTKIECAKIPK